MSQPQDSNIPQLGGMKAATEAMHELYITLQASGFDKDEALKLISGMLSSVIEKSVNEKNSGG